MGVSPVEERIYRLLLRCEGLGVSNLVSRLGLSGRSVVKPLQALESKGMVTHSPDRTRRYFAVPPDIAMEALIESSQRSEEDRQRKARAAIAELTTRVNARGRTHASGERLVEILSPEATAQMFAQMHRTAQSEMLSLTRLPMLISNIDEPDHLFQCLERGIRCRALIDGDLLNMPGWL